MGFQVCDSHYARFMLFGNRRLRPRALCMLGAYSQLGFVRSLKFLSLILDSASTSGMLELKALCQEKMTVNPLGLDLSCAVQGLEATNHVFLLFLCRSCGVCLMCC